MSALDGWIDVCRTGTWRDMSGREVEIDGPRLGRIAGAYAEADPAPVVVGHPATDAPAYARIERLRVVGDRLQAKLSDIAAPFRDAVEAGRYTGRSIALKGDELRHLGFLGGVAPAVPGLAPTSFADPADTVVEFADEALWDMQSGWRAMASIARAWRDRLIEKESLEVADQVIPDWQVESINRAAEAAAEAARADGPGLASPPIPQTAETDPDNPGQEDPLSGNSGGADAPDEAALAAREASLNERETELAAREASAAAAARSQAAAQLLEPHVTAGRILPAERPALAALLASLPDDDESVVAFAAPEGEGEVREKPSQILDRLFAALPKRVNYERLATGPAPAAAQGTGEDDAAIAAEARTLMAEEADRGVTLSAVDAVDRVRAKRGLPAAGGPS